MQTSARAVAARLRALAPVHPRLYPRARAGVIEWAYRVHNLELFPDLSDHELIEALEAMP